jgi:hypothetical protein
MECAATATGGAGIRVNFVVPSANAIAQRIGPGPVDALWFDLSLFDNNFRGGTFIGNGPHLPRQASPSPLDWHGLLLDRQHDYRVNAFAGGRWREVGRGSFVTPDCANVSRQICEGPGTVAVSFVSAHRAPAGRAPTSSVPAAKWVDISLQDNGFIDGTYLGRQLQSDSVVWEGIAPALRHVLRINWFYPGGIGWRVQALDSFVSLDCRNILTS